MGLRLKHKENKEDHDIIGTTTIQEETEVNGFQELEEIRTVLGQETVRLKQELKKDETLYDEYYRFIDGDARGEKGDIMKKEKFIYNPSIIDD